MGDARESSLGRRRATIFDLAGLFPPQGTRNLIHFRPADRQQLQKEHLQGIYIAGAIGLKDHHLDAAVLPKPITVDSAMTSTSSSERIGFLGLLKTACLYALATAQTRSTHPCRTVPLIALSGATRARTAFAVVPSA
jgi:hypothetical protein